MSILAQRRASLRLGSDIFNLLVPASCYSGGVTAHESYVYHLSPLQDDRMIDNETHCQLSGVCMIIHILTKALVLEEHLANILTDRVRSKCWNS